MILRGFSNGDIANSVLCTLHAVRKIRLTYSRFGIITAPANRSGPDPKITPVILDALCNRLAKEPDMVLCEIVAFISDKF